MLKEKLCTYCNHFIEVHHIISHERSCYLKPSNIQKICNYLKVGIIDKRLLRRAAFYSWAMEENILTSITITNRMGLSSWQQALYQLLIYGYLLGCIEFEYVEVLLSILSYESMWMDKEDWLEVRKVSLEEDLQNRGVDKSELFYNYYLLLMCIIARANQDMAPSDYPENDIDVCDAASFMSSFSPEIVASRLRNKNNLYSEEAIRCLAICNSNTNQEIDD